MMNKIEKLIINIPFISVLLTILLLTMQACEVINWPIIYLFFPILFVISFSLLFVLFVISFGIFIILALIFLSILLD